MTDEISFARAGLDDPDASMLITALNAELSAQYPEEGANHFRLEPSDVAPGRGVFLVAREASTAIACGAIRMVDPGTAEIKRMYTVPGARGRGIAALILQQLEDAARDLGAQRVVLETGTRQTEAMALYARAGFVRIPCFGEYADSPLSVCMEKQLAH